MAVKRSRKPAKKPAREQQPDVAVTIDAERLAFAKKAESIVETSRLSYEEAKAKSAMARAELKLLIARRNLAISRATEPQEVEDMQRQVDNAKLRAAKAKSLLSDAKDEWAGAEDRLAKTLTEKLPLFD